MTPFMEYSVNATIVMRLDWLTIYPRFTPDPGRVAGFRNLPFSVIEVTP